MADNNNDRKFWEERSGIEKAHAALREETLPGLANAYDKAGPAAVLTLAFILADVWLESGFTMDEWREVMPEIAPAR
jgi:hypothetical protein